MPRSYRRRVAYRGARDKYSVEQTAFVEAIDPASTGSIDVVPPSDLQGMRKVKHLTISASVSGAVYWALMYIPQGFTVPSLNISTSGTSLVEPNQYVMNCGILDPDAGPIRIGSRLSRNLNSGDKVVLLMRSVNPGGTTNVHGIVRYAITLQ